MFVNRDYSFLNFCWYDESASNQQNVITDAVYNLADKLKSSVTAQLPSFGIRKFLGYTPTVTKSTKTAAVDVRSCELLSRSMIADLGRVGEKICTAPIGWHLAAVIDAHARVILVDVSFWVDLVPS
jgi:hypothetical protein